MYKTFAIVSISLLFSISCSSNSTNNSTSAKTATKKTKTKKAKDKKAKDKNKSIKKKAQTLLKSGNTKEAIKIFDDIIKKDKKN
ncbi:MAG: hypothetical protein ACQES9_13115, partial [Myxococcota bacterium]